MSDSAWQMGNPPPPGNGYGGPDALASNPNYPVTSGFDAPLQVARWRVIGNPIMSIPHFIVLYILQIVSNVLLIVGWFVALFTGHLPDGIGNFVAGVHRYQFRVLTFYLFMREQYPSFGIPSGYAEPGGDQVWLQIAPPQSLSRLAVLFRIILVIPQLLFGLILYIGVYVSLIVAFFAVLITGGWPAGLRKFVLGVVFWGNRVNAWYGLLVDQYPPFSIG